MDTLFVDVIPSPPATPAASRHTLFFGLLPPADVASRAHALAHRLIASGEASGVLRPQHVLHVSLVLIGKDLVEPPPSGLAAALRFRAAAVRQRPFAVGLTRIETWGRSGFDGPVVVAGGDGVIGVETLHRRLAEALGMAARPQFNPHMTLLYGRGPRAPLPIPPLFWTVREFVLIHSLSGLTRYEVLDRFPLSAEAGA